MATATASNYSAGSGENIFIGLLQPTALSTLAASLTVNQMATLTTTGLDALDGTPINAYPNESILNDIAQDWTIDAIWIPLLQKGFYAGSGNGYLGDSPPGLHSILLEYDAETSIWSSTRNPFNSSLVHGYSMIAAVGALIYRMSWLSLDMFVWNALTGEFIETITGPSTSLGGSAAWSGITGLTFMPTMGVDGSIIHVNSSEGRLTKYDLNTKVWSNIASSLSLSSGVFCHYNEFSDTVVFGGASSGSPIYTMDNTGSTTLTDNLPANVFDQSCFVAAPNSNDSILFAEDGNMYPLNTTNGVWGSSSSIPTLSGGDIANSIAMTIPEHNCILFEKWVVSGASQTYLYRYS